jgi:hypothetical protein
MEIHFQIGLIGIGIPGSKSSLRILCQASSQGCENDGPTNSLDYYLQLLSNFTVLVLYHLTSIHYVK